MFLYFLKGDYLELIRLVLIGIGSLVGLILLSSGYIEFYGLYYIWKRLKVF